VRIVIDTNLLLSALMRRDAVPDLLVRAWLEGQFTLLTHEIQIAELRVASRRERVRTLIRPSEPGKLVNQIRQKAEFLDRLPNVRRSPDPFDDYLLALSEVGMADFLVTGDKAGLLVLGTHGGTAILTARRFLDRLSR
jgi:hypothetical protein